MHIKRLKNTVFDATITHLANDEYGTCVADRKDAQMFGQPFRQKFTVTDKHMAVFSLDAFPKKNIDVNFCEEINRFADVTAFKLVHGAAVNNIDIDHSVAIPRDSWRHLG
ncbi:hypothetical protein DPMN_066286 [Dreissena polymorpha]|uniref:Uncharacterized protein n=1 Tax=Dreissena polymorpha TaxID=45954 RepID=A0A9D4BRX8_DREPO|nr:hypothetical protein DPMN_066286 [Dreissena polymorpha]